jgi:hypothetical protein
MQKATDDHYKCQKNTYKNAAYCLLPLREEAGAVALIASGLITLAVSLV